MQYLQHFIQKYTNYVLAGLLSLLGFSSCGDADLEYGTPHATYEIKGKVTDEAGKPIPDVHVQCSTEYTRENSHGYDRIPAVRTSSDGTYLSRFGEFPTSSIRVVVTDVDGEANGSFQPDSVDIIITQKDYKKPSGHWDEGTATKENISFKLKAAKK